MNFYQKIFQRTLRKIFLLMLVLLSGAPAIAAVKPAITSFSATNGTIAPGGTTTLNWVVSANTSSLSLTPGGAVTGTSMQVSPSATTTYTLRATNATGSVTKSTTVKVAVMPVISSFGTSAASIVSGSTARLSWTVSAGAALTLSPGGAVTGSFKDVSPATSTSYTLTATNLAGSVDSEIVSVAVTAAPPVPVISAFDSTPPANPGDPTTLSWSVADATTVSIDQGVGVVSGNSILVSPSVTTSYTLTAMNAAGPSTAVVTVNVPAASSPATIVSVHQIRQDWGQSEWSSSSVPLLNVQEGDSIIVLGMYWVSSGTNAAPSDSNGQLIAAVNQVPVYQHPPVAAQIYYQLNVAAGDHLITPPNLAYGGDGTFYVLQMRNLAGIRAVGDAHRDDNVAFKEISAQLTTAAVAGDFVVAIGGEDNTRAFGSPAGMRTQTPGWQIIGAQNDADMNVPSIALYSIAPAAGNQAIKVEWNDSATNVAGAAIAAFSVIPSTAPALTKPSSAKR